MTSLDFRDDTGTVLVTNDNKFLICLNVKAGKVRLYKTKISFFFKN